MQQRLAALLVIAVIPLCVLTGLLAWQNYVAAASDPRRHVETVQQAVVGRYDTIIDDAARLLEALALDPVLQTGTSEACDDALQRVYTLEHAAFGGISVVDEQGQIRCAATDRVRGRRGEIFAEAAAQLADPSHPGFAIALLPLGPFTGHPVLMTSTRIASGPTIPSGSGVLLLASLRLEWLTQPRHAALPDANSSVWFIDAAGRVMQIAAGSSASFPSIEDQKRITGAAEGITIASPAGAVHNYRITELVSGLRVLVGTVVSPEVALARWRLGVRLAELAALVVGGLIVVMLGANLTVVKPLRHLTMSVQRWRAGGSFNARPPRRAPAEIRELVLSFYQATTSIAEREKQLRTSIAKQDLLMQEIHHRVKNNLQIVASLLNLQANRIRQPEAKAEFQSARDRIRALATLHRHLYAHNELHTINMRSFLNELCSQLIAAIGDRPGESAQERIDLQIEAPELQISSDQAVPIALIVTETVSNAAKYAFPDGRTGHVSVRLTTEGDRALLTICDDGVGITATRVLAVAEARDGLGLQLIRGFARQLDATFTVVESSGTRYTFDIPLHRARELASVAAEA